MKRQLGVGVAWPLLVLIGCGPKTEPTQANRELVAVPVTVADVQGVAVQRAVVATGTLNAFEDVMLTPKVDGKVIAIHADVGDRLTPGSALLDLDPADYLLAVQEARRALEAEMAPLGLLDLPPEALTAAQPFAAALTEVVPTVLLAEVSRQNAEKKYRLWKNTGNPSQLEMLGAELELKSAEANKKVAVSAAEARLAAARLRKAMLETAEQRLRDTKLRVPELPAAAEGSPIPASARYAVAQKTTGIGEMIRTMPTSNVFRLVIDGVLKLRVAVPEKYIPDVVVGQTVDVTVEAYGLTFVGRVVRVSPTVDVATRTFNVEIEVPNADGKLKAGGFARAAVRVRSDRVRAVPNAALVTFAGVTKVFVAENGQAKAVPVTVGQREKEWSEVTGELPANACVITSGFSQLHDGCPIRVREAAKQN